MTKRWEVLFWGVITVLFSLVPFIYLQNAGREIHLDLPLFQIHDDFKLVANLILGLVKGEVLPFIKNELPRMGAPFHPLNFSEGFPLPEQLQLAVIKAFTFFSTDPTALTNLYFLFGYILAALAFFISAASLGIHPAISFGLSAAFTYLPFHHLRYEHLFLSQYWILAPAAAITIHTLKSEAAFTRRQIVFLVGAVFFVTLWHSYYGYFFTGVLCLALLLRAFRLKERKISPLMVLVVLVFISAIGISVAHHGLALRKSDDRPTLFKRNPSDTLLFGLRPWVVFLPIEGHRFPLFKSIRAQAMVDRGRIEGMTESIGTLGFLGVLIGLYQLIRKRWKSGATLRFQLEATLTQVLTFAFASKIGVAVLIAYTVSPVFRSTNRISPMLAAGALFSLGLVLTERIGRIGPVWKRRMGVGLLGVALAVFAVWDQVLVIEGVDASQADMRITRKFVEEIETKVGDGAVLQLPVSLFPEQGAIYGMGDYAHSVGPLFSNRTRWSYGTWRGTRAMAEEQDAARDPADFPRLRKLGFSGVWIDRNGLPNQGEALITEITKKNGAPSLISDDGRRVFFAIPK